jgi:hypothetical protein
MRGVLTMHSVNRSKALNNVYDGREKFQSRIRYLGTFRRLFARVVVRGITAAGAARHRLKQKKKPPVAGGFFTSSLLSLLKLGRDAREIRVELRAQGIDDGDNRNRDAGGDQAVFDGGSAIFVFQESNKLGHTYYSEASPPCTVLPSGALKTSCVNAIKRINERLRWPIAFKSTLHKFG